MTFEEWQTANFDPEEIGLMQLARVTWDAAKDDEREECAKLCESFLDPDIESNTSYADAVADGSIQQCADAIRARSNA